MIIMPMSPGGRAIFADDLREEVSGKTSLIGIYSSEMLVQASPPAIIPQLICQVNITLDPEDLPEGLSVEVRRFLANGDVEVLARFALDNIREIPLPPYVPGFGDVKQINTLSAAARISPLSLGEDCTLRAIMTIGDDEYRIGSLNVRFVSESKDASGAAEPTH
jgi:hypothetical protein